MFIKNIYIRIFTNVFKSVLGFISSILVVRTFGIDVIGMIAYYLGIAGVFSIVSDLGISSAYTKFIATGEEEEKYIFHYFFLKALLIIGFIIIIVVVYFVNFRNTLDPRLFLIQASIVVLSLLSALFTGTMTAKRDFMKQSVIEGAAQITLFVYTVVICLLKLNIYFLAMNMILFYCIIITGGFTYFAKNGLFKITKIDKAILNRYWKFSLPIAFSSAVSMGMTYIDKVVIGRLIGITELGFYQLAMKLFGFVDNTIKPVTTTMYTETLHRISEDKNFYHKKFRDLVFVLTFTGVLIVFFFLYLSTPIIHLLYGPENIRAAFILKFFSLVVIAKLFWRPYHNVIYAIEKHHLLGFISVLTALITVGAYFILIPLHIGDIFVGGAGIAITQFITWLFPAGVFVTVILRKEYSKTYVGESFLKIIFPALPIIFVGMLLNFPIYLFPVSLIVYIGIEIILKIVNRQNINYILMPIRQLLASLKPAKGKEEH